MLKVRLREVSLADSPNYYYADIRKELTLDSWPEKAAVICNNRLLSLSKPFQQILLVILSKGPRTFWIDTICVDHRSSIDLAHHATLTDARLRKQAKEVIGITQPKFVYIPLPESPPHIRLLKLLPASANDDTLVADLGHFALDQCPPFVALSYVWGPLDPKWMLCTRDGRYITCTPNLRDALCHLRESGQLIVWAHAICINQKDNLEKNKQVLLMGDIYKRASRVVVDLGVTCQEKNHFKCRVLPSILIRMLSLTRQVLEAVRPERPALDNREYSIFGIPEYGHQAWSGWRTMRSTPWFTRSWIVQEVTAGREVVVHHNGNTYDWKDLDMANRVTGNEEVHLKAYIGKMNMTNMGDLHDAVGMRLPNLLTLMTVFRSLDATDPRDKIYAFRGLAVDRDSSSLPDYSRSVEEVYCDFASFFIKQGYGMQLLVEAGLSRSQRPLPSWVPDWSLSLFWQTWNFSNKALWMSLKGMQENEQSRDVGISSIEIENPKALKLLGNAVDEIMELSSPVPNTFEYDQGPEDRVRIDNSIAHLYAEAQSMISRSFLDSDQSIVNLQNTLFGGSEKRFTPLSTAYIHSKIVCQHAAHGNDDDRAIRAFDMDLRQQLSYRRFCRTRDDRIRLVPSIAEVGDSIVWLKGGTAPFVLRNNGTTHLLIGDACLNDCFGGTSMLPPVSPEMEFQEILLS